jgi:hypothetical protein
MGFPAPSEKSCVPFSFAVDEPRSESLFLCVIDKRSRLPMPAQPMRTQCSPAVFLLLAGVLSVLPGTVIRADEPVGGAEVISLEDQLKTGLKARRPEETEFIDEVARLVNTGKLPRKLVDSTFMWALRRRTNYPFPAFERALRLQADQLGVDL